MPERIVSEEQQRDGPGMGFPEGPGAFELRLCRASLTYRCGYARSALRGSLRIRSGKPGTNLPFSVLRRDRYPKMSTISLRLSESLHKQARELADKEHLSINQLIATALAEKLSALLTREYLRERSERGNRRKFQRVLAKIRDQQPDGKDAL